MRFRQKMLLVMVWLLTLSYGVGGLLLIRQNFRSSLEQTQNNCAESYEMLLQTVQLVNFVDIQQDFSNISTALERMNSANSLVGISTDCTFSPAIILISSSTAACPDAKRPWTIRRGQTACSGCWRTPPA